MKVLVFPYDQNPYIKLLYTQLEKQHCTVTYFPTHINPDRLFSIVLMFFALVAYRIRGFTVFHMHFLYPFSLASKEKAPGPIAKLFSFFAMLKFVALIRMLGFKFVYTVHNITPHQAITTNDLFITKYLCTMAHTVICISEQSKSELAQLGIPESKISIIPLGNYIDVYPIEVSQIEARKKLGLQNEFTILFFGIVREYKGIDKLLEAFENLLKKFPETQLVIAGNILEKDMKMRIQKAQSEYPKNIFVFNNHIPDTEVQNYFQAADVVALPFKKVTNSSSVLLPMSLKKPVMYPKLGNMKEIPNDAGIGYEPAREGALENALETAIQSKKELATVSTRGYEYVKNFSWEEIATQHIECYFGSVK